MSSKRIKITPEIQAFIRSAVGDPSLDTSNFAVFEASTLSTQPIQRKSGFHQNARVSATTLAQMANLVNTPGKALHLQIMHQNEMLPVGRVFRAQLLQTDTGDTELRTMFYLPSDKTQLISDIENALIDEVSVGLLTDHAFCSECEFDFFGPDASFSNFMTLTCANDHTIGDNGTHVRLVGMKDFAELSLVNRGAAKDAKILSRAKQVMGQDAVEKLAASATPMDARIVTINRKLEAFASGNSNKGDLSMDTKEFLATLQAKTDEVAAANVKVTALTGENGTLTAKVTELTAALAAKDTEFSEFKKSAGVDKETLVANAQKAEKELKDAAEKLLPHAKAALVASGVAETSLPSTLTALLAMIEEKGLKLHQVFGSADAGKTDVKDTSGDNDARKAAFKLNR